MIKRLWLESFLVTVLSGVIVVALVAPAVAKSAEPPIAVRAWYWEQAQSQEITDPAGNTYNVGTTNPFCPTAPGSLGSPEQTCAEGRLPVEISDGDYETPNKLSAVNFDLSLVPIGSTVSKFTVTFLEAKSGCYDNADENQSPNWCEETNPRGTIDEKQLQACLVNSFFGEGDARPYKETPKYTCSPTDPTATRKEKEVKGETEHFWTFDLTSFAQEWIKEFTTNTSIMLAGAPPKGYKPGDTDSADDWRVVLMGPKAPEGKEGVITKIVFEPGELDVIAPPAPTGTTGTTSTTGTTGTAGGFTSSGTGGGFTTGGGGFGTGGGSLPTDAGSPVAPPLAAVGGAETQPGLPPYVALGLIAGVIGWFLFRSAVLETAKGIRPDGVLAQIHRLTAAGRGTEAAAEAGGASLFAPIKSGFSSVLSKLKLTRKG